MPACPFLFWICRTGVRASPNFSFLPPHWEGGLKVGPHRFKDNSTAVCPPISSNIHAGHEAIFRGPLAYDFVSTLRFFS